MFLSRNKVPVTLLLTLASVSATQIAYLTNVTKVWEESTSSVQQGNGVFLSPNGDTAVVVSRDATVRAFDILTGNVTWTFPPPTSNSESFSGAFFITNSTTPYIAYSVVFGGGINR